MGRPMLERPPCTWRDCIHYDKNKYTHCMKQTNGDSCLELKPLPTEEESDNDVGS